MKPVHHQKAMSPTRIASFSQSYARVCPPLKNAKKYEINESLTFERLGRS